MGNLDCFSFDTVNLVESFIEQIEKAFSLVSIPIACFLKHNLNDLLCINRADDFTSLGASLRIQLLSFIVGFILVHSFLHLIQHFARFYPTRKLLGTKVI